MISLWAVLILICYPSRGLLTVAYTLEDEQNLQTALLSGYSKGLRPGRDRSFPMTLNMTFGLLSIKEFDLNTGKFSLTGVFQLNWIDERLSWNPANYNQTNSTVISQSLLWLPDLINVNPYEEITGLRLGLSIVVESTGLCNWYAIQTFETVCDTDVTNYPFDTQICSLKFYVWGYDPTDIDVVFVAPKVVLHLYSENGIWEIQDSATYTKINVYNYKEIIVDLFLKRRTSYYVVSLILPLIFIAFLMGFVFLLPADSGERVGFSTTVLLSIVVYLTIIQDILPESSEPNVSTLGFILVTFVVNGSFVVIAVIISLRIQGQSCQKAVPLCINRVALYLRRRRKTKDMVEPLDTKSELNYEDEEEKVTWHEVAKCFDMFCFILLQIFFFVTSTSYLIIVNT